MTTLYRDRLIEVTDQEIVFHHYHFPFGNARRVALSEIESVQVKLPTLASGRWRLWGTGDFRTWFPNDGRRPQRDRIFIACLRQSSRRSSWLADLLKTMTGGSFRHIGFTAEDSEKVAGILKEKGLLDSN